MKLTIGYFPLCSAYYVYAVNLIHRIVYGSLRAVGKRGGHRKAQSYLIVTIEGNV